MARQSLRRFAPAVSPLEGRSLLSTISARLFHGQLTVTRDDASLAIVVDVAARGRGPVVVEGVGTFALKRVKAITINPGSSTQGVTLNVPASRHIPITVNPATAVTHAVSSPPATPLLISVAPPVSGSGGVQSAFEGIIFDLVNAERVKAGVPPLTVNAPLVLAAHIHANDMAALDLMAHDLPGVAQPTLASRAQFVGYHYGWLGENIASYYSDPQQLAAAWMSSAEHRANILNPNLTEAGIGVARDAAGNLFICQEFGSPAA